MTLASMLKHDKNALICDFAEYYRIYDLWTLPARYVSILAIGLSDSSRIKESLSSTPIDLKEIILAAILDQVALINYRYTDGVDLPESMVAKLLNKTPEEGNTIEFSSAEEYKLARDKLINGG